MYLHMYYTEELATLVTALTRIYAKHRSRAVVPTLLMPFTNVYWNYVFVKH